MKYTMLAVLLLGCATRPRPMVCGMNTDRFLASLDGAENARRAAFDCRQGGLDPERCQAWDERAAYWDGQAEEAKSSSCGSPRPSPAAVAAGGIGRAYGDMAAAQAPARRSMNCVTIMTSGTAHTTCN